MKSLFLGLILIFNAMTNSFGQEITMIVGTYTNTSCTSQGIYSFLLNQETAEYQPVGNSQKTYNPSYLDWKSDNQLIYSVNENGDESKISSWNFNHLSGEITLLNQVDSDLGPCFIEVEENFAFIANYNGGSIGVYPILQSGILGEMQQKIQYQGSGKIKERQESAHIHKVLVSPDKKFLVATDLGSDKLYSYRINQNAPKVLSDEIPYSMPAGSGPRHMVFDQSGKFLYVDGELDGNIYIFRFDNGKLDLKNKISILSERVKDNFRVAEIKLSSDEKFLYVSNRDGETNDITVLSIGENKELKIVQQIKTGGNNPRNFNFTPNEKFLVVGNQDTNQIVIFQRDETSGKLKDTGKRIEVCAPVFIGFMK